MSTAVAVLGRIVDVQNMVPDYPAVAPMRGIPTAAEPILYGGIVYITRRSC